MNYLTQALAALVSAAVLAACGGGDADAVVLAAAATVEPTPQDVPLEGCIVDADGHGFVHAVQATGSDGRLLASTSSDAEGVFRLRVPAQRVVLLSTTTASADVLALRTGVHGATLAACLRAAA